jgi:hypothetical protein
MHEAEPRGELRIGTVVPTVEQIAQLVGVPEADVAAAMAELERWDVCSSKCSSGSKILLSRKMIRDTAIAKVRSEAGRKGGTKTQTVMSFAKASDQSSAKAFGGNLLQAKPGSGSRSGSVVLEGGVGGDETPAQKPKPWDSEDWPGHQLVTLWLVEHPHWSAGYDEEALAKVRQDVDRLLRLDKRPADQVAAVMRYVIGDPPSGDWPGWAAQILWPGKLRSKSKSQAPLKHWDVLVRRMESSSGGGHRGRALPPNTADRSKVDDDDDGPGLR